MFFLVEIFKISSAADSISGDPEKADSKETGEELSYIQVLQRGAGNLNIKRLLLKLNFSHEKNIVVKIQASGLAPISLLISRYLPAVTI